MGSIYKRRWKDTEGHVHESDVWWIKYYKDGKPIRESSESTKESDPRKLLNLREVLLPSATDAVKGIPVTPRINRIMFQELANDVINDYKMNRKRSLRDIETRLKLHILPVFSSRRASSITTADIRQYVVARQAAQASNAQINRELTAIKRPALSTAVSSVCLSR